MAQQAVAEHSTDNEVLSGASSTPPPDSIREFHTAYERVGIKFDQQNNPITGYQEAGDNADLQPDLLRHYQRISEIYNRVDLNSLGSTSEGHEKILQAANQQAQDSWDRFYDENPQLVKTLATYSEFMPDGSTFAGGAVETVKRALERDLKRFADTQNPDGFAAYAESPSFGNETFDAKSPLNKNVLVRAQRDLAENGVNPSEQTLENTNIYARAESEFMSTSSLAKTYRIQKEIIDGKDTLPPHNNADGESKEAWQKKHDELEEDRFRFKKFVILGIRADLSQTDEGRKVMKIYDRNGIYTIKDPKGNTYADPDHDPIIFQATPQRGETRTEMYDRLVAEMSRTKAYAYAQRNENIRFAYQKKYMGIEAAQDLNEFIETLDPRISSQDIAQIDTVAAQHHVTTPLNETEGFRNFLFSDGSPVRASLMKEMATALQVGDPPSGVNKRQWAEKAWARLVASEKRLFTRWHMADYQEKESQACEEYNQYAIAFRTNEKGERVNFAASEDPLIYFLDTQAMKRAGNNLDQYQIERKRVYTEVANRYAYKFNTYAKTDPFFQEIVPGYATALPIETQQNNASTINERPIRNTRGQIEGDTPSNIIPFSERTQFVPPREPMRITLPPSNSREPVNGLFARLKSIFGRQKNENTSVKRKRSKVA